MKTLKKRYYHWRADVHLLPYPKCGRTWLRLMLATLLCEHFDLPVRNLDQIHKRASWRRGIPCIYLTHDWRGVSRDGSAVAVATNKRRFEGRKVLLLVRDPRDVVVSSFFQKKYRGNTFDGNMHEFVRDPVLGIQGIVDYYTVWARERSVTSEFEVVRYEDMHKDVVGEMMWVLAYCGINGISREHIADVAERFRFDRMQRMEREGTFSGKSMSPGDAGNPQSYKTRSGRIGDHKEHLSDDDVVYIEEVIQKQLDPWFSSYHVEHHQ